MWFALAIGGYAVLTAVTLLDKVIISKKSVSPLAYTFYSSVFLLALVVCLPFGVKQIFGFDWLTVLLAGLSFVLGLWTSFVSFNKSEVSHAGPLIGAATALFILLLNIFFLKESFTAEQFLGIGFLIVGCLLISFEKSKSHNGWHAGFLWAIISALCFAISHMATKYVYNDYGFYTGLVWTRMAIGFFGLLVIFSAAARKEMFHKTDKVNKQKKSNKMFLVVLNKVLSVVGTLFVQYAIALGSVVIVNALLGVQYALLILVVAMLSKFYPKIFKEEYTKGEILQEFSAVILIAAGLVFLL